MTALINKLFRFFVFEMSGRTRLIIGLVLLGLIAAEVVVLGKQAQVLQKVESQKALVMRMPEMQAQLEILRNKNTEIPLAPRVELNWKLSGTITQTKKPLAFINEQVYEVGSEIEGHKILFIGREMILIKNLATQETQSLYFSQQ